jgi:DNA repair photolyase
VEIKEIYAKTILSKSGILDYCINPYVGCEHACKYCYASYYTRIFRNKKEKRREEIIKNTFLSIDKAGKI